jgi:hypothetical protein
LTADFVAVLLALFSIAFRDELHAELEGRAVRRRSTFVSVSELERMLGDRAPEAG